MTSKLKLCRHGNLECRECALQVRLDMVTSTYNSMWPLVQQLVHHAKNPDKRIDRHRNVLALVEGLEIYDRTMATVLEKCAGTKSAEDSTDADPNK